MENAPFASTRIVVRLCITTMALLLLVVACSDEGTPVQNGSDKSSSGQRIASMPKVAATILGSLNPLYDPFADCGVPFSSGGYNVPPVWVQHTYDLSAYANKNVRILFVFSTNDDRYNKHEGWFVDDINIDGTVDDVESGAGGWTSTGYWHISATQSHSSSHSWRYANSATGYYQGAYILNDCFDQENQGTLTSAVIGLGPNPSLSFYTRWQIEAVNPSTFDMMQIYVENEGVISAAIDAKPGGCPNPFNVNANGTFPVAIVGVPGFDVGDVNQSTVRLAGVLNGPQPPLSGDVSTPYGAVPTDCMDCNALGPDGTNDMTFYFNVPAVATAIDPVNDNDCKPVWLTGRLNNGLNFAGKDVLKIIKKK